MSDIREDDARGRHTTTRRELVLLPGGGVLIDTPGMRELGLIEDDGGIDTVFADVAEIAQTCRFNDCLHESEPGCAVQAALYSGILMPSDSRATVSCNARSRPPSAARPRPRRKRTTPLENHSQGSPGAGEGQTGHWR